MSPLNLARLLLCPVLVVACGDSKKNEEGGPAKPVETVEGPKEVEAHHLGVASPRSLGYRWGSGSKEFDKAEELLKAEARDWDAIATACQAAISADKGHLEAHRLLGIALANKGDNAKAAEHLSIALAADWLEWGPTLADDKSLEAFFATSEGKGLLALNDTYKEDFYKSATAGVLVVAKRTGWKRPSKIGRQWAASRGELFAYDLESEHYLRLTHTGEAVVGFVESPSKDQLAVLTVTHYEFAEAGPAPTATAGVVVLDRETFMQVGKTARIKKSAPALALYYGPGEELLLDALEAVYSVDADGGKLVKSRAKSLGDWESLAANSARSEAILYANSEFAQVLSPWGVSMVRPNAITVGASELVLPDAGGATIRRVALSPDSKRVVFAGIGDPCRKDHKTSLYVGDAESGAIKHVHRGGGLESARWLDADRFIFEAEEGELRVYDAKSNNMTHKIENRAGISLAAVSNAASGEPCLAAPAPAAPTEPAPPIE